MYDDDVGFVCIYVTWLIGRDTLKPSHFANQIKSGVEFKWFEHIFIFKKKVCSPSRSAGIKRLCSKTKKKDISSMLCNTMLTEG